MDIHLVEIGIRSRKIVIYTSRRCYRSVCRHPFLIGFLCLLICLYRSFPLIFSLLVSASPVLVCTAVLLGTLLSLGQPNIPEIEKEGKTTAYEAVLIRTGVSIDAPVVVEKIKGCLDENFSNEVDSFSSELGGVPGEVVSEDTIPLIGDRERSRDVALRVEETEGHDSGDGTCSDNRGECSQEIELNVGERWESKVMEKMEWNEERQSDDGEVLENHYSPIPMLDDGRSSSDDEKTEGADCFGSEKVNVDTLDSPPRLPWTQVESREEEVARKGNGEDEDGEDVNSGSDRAESSSPDASMTDIMPMLDELHPLLDQDIPRPGHFFLDGSDAASERSQESSGHELGNEAINHDDDDDDDNQDEEDGHGKKKEGIKSAITWTEEDQKNLVDLGSSEIERNLRLENLILRRRARRNINMLPEQDLIDLESLDFPFSVAPISTRWQNPFDHPNDSHDDSGLPPIPGSAPSVLLPRRNPFDIPYDSNKEKPDLSGGGFQQECTFRRHGSLNVRPSVFAQDGMSYYSTPEQMISEDSRYSLFQRQLSEISESKVSSVMETETISSVENMRDGKYSEDDILGKVEFIQQMKASSKGGSSSVNPEQVLSVHQECGLTSILESISECVNESSEGPEWSSSVGQAKKVEYDGDELKFQVELTQLEEAHATKYNPDLDIVGKKYKSRSSLSSLSEESERVFTEMESEEFLNLERRDNTVAVEPEITTQTSVERTDQLSITNASVVNVEIAHWEPVYDCSPHEVIGVKILASNSTDLLLSASETVSSVKRESEVTSSGNESSVLSDTSDKPSVNENTVEKRDSGEASTAFPSADHVHLLDVFSEDQSRQDQPQEETKYFEKVVESRATNAYVTCEAVENLISFHDEGINTSTTHRQAIPEPFFEHPHQIEESCVPPNLSNLTMQEFSLVENQELECNISSTTEGLLIPDFSSVGPSAFETAKPHSDLQTIVEEADVIKEIDEGLLSELDNVGDFIIGQWEYESTKFRTNEESPGGSFNSSQHLEMSKTGGVEVNSVEEILHSEIPSRDVVVGLLKMDSKESNVRDPPDQEASVLVMEGTEAVHVHSTEENNTSVVPEVENEITSGDVDISPQLSRGDSTMPELEASTIEEIDAVFKKISGEEIDKPVKQPPVDDEQLNDEQMVESGDKIENNAETILFKSDGGLEEIKGSDKEGPSTEEASDFLGGKLCSEVEEQISMCEVEAPKEFGEANACKESGDVEVAKEFGIDEVDTPKDLGEVVKPKHLDSTEGDEEKGNVYKSLSTSSNDFEKM